MHPPIPPRAFAPALDLTYRVWRRAVRWEVRDPHEILAEPPRGRIFACRHGQLLPLLWAMEDHHLTILVSRSGDGDLLAAILRRRGFGVIRGSTTTAGFRAAREALRVLRSGGALGMAVDGPRGPRGQVHPGILRIAAQASAPIIPLWVDGGRPHVAPGSWDHFEVPRWGQLATVHVGAPVDVPRSGVGQAGERLAVALGGRWRAVTEEPAATPRPFYGHP